MAGRRPSGLGPTVPGRRSTSGWRWHKTRGRSRGECRGRQTGRGCRRSAPGRRRGRPLGRMLCFVTLVVHCSFLASYESRSSREQQCYSSHDGDRLSCFCCSLYDDVCSFVRCLRLRAYQLVQLMKEYELCTYVYFTMQSMKLWDSGVHVVNT